MADNREKNLSKKAVTGFFWNNASGYIQSITRFFGIIYLARQIDPVYFGKQGLPAAIVTIVYSLVMFGQMYAIPRRKDNISSYMSMHVSLRMIMTIAIGLVLIALYFFTNFINREMFGYVVILFLAQLPSQITSIYVSFMQRELLFGRIAIINVTSVVFAVTLSCILAFLGYKIWALLWLLMGEYIMQALMTVILSPKRFLPKFNVKMAKEFFKYGRYVFVTNLVSRAHDRADDISVGTLLGEASLGFYQRAWGLCGLLHLFVTGGVTAVTPPVFAVIREDRERLGQYFELLGSLLLRLAVGAYVWMAIVLPELIVLLYGEKWLPAVSLFRLMLPYALVQSFNLILQNTHLVTGESFKVARIKFVEFFILIISLFPLLHLYKTAGAAIAVDISAVVGTAIFLYFLRPIARFSLKQIFVSPIVAAITGFIGWKIFSLPAESFNSLVAKLLMDSFIFMSLYICCLLVIEFSYLKGVFFSLKKQVVT